MLPLLSLLPSIVSGFGTVAGLVAKYFPNDADKAAVAQIQAEIKVIEDEVAEKIRQHDETMANLEINKLQAQSEDKFTNRARPFGMWCAAAGIGVVFPITFTTLLICVLFFGDASTRVLDLLDKLSVSGYLSVFITLTLGMFGLRGGEKAFTMWRSGKDACPPDEIMTYDTKSKGKVGK